MQDVTINNQDVNTDRAKINEPLAHLDDGLAGKARKKFIMKVYMILAGKKFGNASSIFDNSWHVFCVNVFLGIHALAS